jgi:hypothetical protein
VTLNLPAEPFYECLKLMFVACVMVSYPLQFFVPMERIEKFITRKCAEEKHIRNVGFYNLFPNSINIATLVYLGLYGQILHGFADLCHRRNGILL